MDLASPAHRRWPWWLGGSLLALLAVAGAAWVFGPRVACGLLARRLPLDLGHGYELTAASTRLPPGRSQATLAFGPERARRLADSLPHAWVPPGMLRPGLTIAGTGRLPKDLVDFGWRMTVARQPEATLRIRLTPEEANDLLSPYRRFPIDRKQALFITWEVREAQARDDDPPDHSRDERRVRVDAVGAMRLEWHDHSWRIEVRHLVAHVAWRFAEVPGGLRPSCRLTIDSVDADLPRLPGMKDWRTLWSRVEQAADRSFAKRLAKRTWPRGAPIDAVVDGRIAKSDATD